MKLLFNFSLAIVLALFFSNLIFAQAPLQKEWDYRFGGADREFLFSFQQTTDKGYLLGGHSNSGIGGDKTVPPIGSFDFWLVKLDSLGLKQWDKGYGGFDADQLYSVQETSDGGYIMGGWSASGVGGDKSQPNFGGFDYWVVKIDSLGNKQWDKTFGGDQNDALFNVTQTANNNYIIGGWSQSGISGNKTIANYGGADYWVILIDSVGNKIWENVYGGTGDDVYHVMKPTNDGGFILGGFSNSGISGIKTQGSFGDYDYWIVKIDAAGNVLWDQTFGGTKIEVLIDIEQTAEGGYIMGGITKSDIGGNKTSPIWGFNTMDYWIIKTDSLGVKEWEKDFGGTDDEDDFGTILQTPDKGYFMTGCSYSNISGNKTENNLGFEQTWIIKTDSLGNIMWDKTVATPGHIENAFALLSSDVCYTIVHSDDGGIGGYKSQASRGLEDYWIVKLCDTTTIAATPLANFSSSNSDTCGAVVVNFQDASLNNPIAWAWLFPGASPANSTAQNPQGITYTSSGSYNITLIACNTSGCDTITITEQINVQQNNPVVSVGPDLILCDNDSVLLTATPGFPLYLWVVNGTTQASNLNTFYAGQQGNYVVIVTDSIGCKGSDSTDIQVLAIPLSDFNYQLQLSCNGIELSTENLSTDATNYLWDFGDGNNSTEISPVHYYTEVQNLTLQLIASNSICSDTLKVENISFEIPEFQNISNVFTPNADNLNECFQIKGIDKLSDCYSLNIFNRWGDLVFETDDSLNCWDGKNMNKDPLPAGVYYYLLAIQNDTHKGVVHLLY